MRLLLALLLALSTASPVAAQQGPCREGMSWTAGEGSPPAAWYGPCDTPERATFAMVCVDEAVRVTLDVEMPGAESGAAVSFDLRVDDGVYAMPGVALARPGGGGVQPLLSVGPEALDALMQGRRATITLPDGEIAMHLAGSAQAIAPVRSACAPT